LHSNVEPLSHNAVPLNMIECALIGNVRTSTELVTVTLGSTDRDRSGCLSSAQGRADGNP
jgi:hypothetical protein